MSVERVSSYTPSFCSHWTYDVFISFRGEDTRNNFTSHLYAALHREGIKVFKDDKELERGKSISPELLKAIDESRFSIIVFSKNYACSTWCLEELAKIVERKNARTDQQMVFPVFYDVEPTVVRKQKGNFQEAFAKHEETFRDNIEKVQKWRDALEEVANIAGQELKDRNQSEFIDDIVKEISSKLTPSEFETHRGLVGMKSRLEELMVLLDANSNGVRMIGICGMGGLGKTTIASVIYDLISNKFEGRCFLPNVREISEKFGLITLQKQLLSILLRLTDSNITHLHDGTNMIANRLRRKKVLLVIDDVDDEKQLNCLAGNQDWFGSGSRIIVTTRNKQLMMSHGVDVVYKLQGLNDDEALQLFCMKAFKADRPTQGYEELSKCVVQYAAGLPLALAVLGCLLFGRTVQVWESTLQRLKRDSAVDILKILQISFDGLEETEKKIFLDIACFFKWEYRDFVTKILKDSGFHPKSGIDVLIDKSLISIEDNRFWMHDLLQQMGQQIVKRESKEPGNRSRLWEEADVHHVLSENTGTHIVEGISLNFGEENMHLGASAFSRMTNLRLLRISKVQLQEGLEYLSNELRLLEWYGYPLKLLPASFRMEKLFELNLQGSSIEQLWQGVKHLNMLKVMKLAHCRDLIKTPDFTGVSNLEMLTLDGCTNLQEIHPSLLRHKKLAVLDMRHCSSLKKLPQEIDMHSLTKFVLSGCSKLQNFPRIESGMECLSELFLDGTAITELSPSIQLLSGLVWLNLKHCQYFKCLPDTISGLTRLKILNLSGCSKLKTFPKILGSKECLQELFLDGTAITEIPPETSGIRCLKTLDLSGCSKLKKIPDIVGSMECMSRLFLDGSAIKEVPLPVKFMPGLILLSAMDCKNLETLPTTLSCLKCLETLNLSGCSKLKKLPEIVERMERLSKLYLDGTAIEEPPLPIELLSGLVLLSLNNCKNLVGLPNTINGMKSLKKLYLSGCSKLENVPENLGKVESLEELDISGTAIRQPVSSIFYLKNLELLSFCGIKAPPTSWFSRFQRRSLDPVALMLPSFSGLCSLTSLNLSDCNLGEGAIPSDICNLLSLRILYLSRNNFVSLPATMNCLSNLEYLDLEDCKRFQTLPELPSSIYSLRLDGCDSLETALDAFISRDIGFIFCTNCLKVVGNNDNVFSGLKRFIEANPIKFSWLVFPGSKIPKWFRYQNEGSSIKVTSPPDYSNRKKLVGYAICCVFHVPKPPYKPYFLEVISMQFRNTSSFLGFEWQLVRPVSDHLWLDYCPNYPWLVKSDHLEVSFRPDYSSHGHGVKRCGVHPVYVDDSDDDTLMLDQATTSKRSLTEYAGSEDTAIDDEPQRKRFKQVFFRC